MEKEQNQKFDNDLSKEKENNKISSNESNETSQKENEAKIETQEKNLEEIILELEDKLARTFAEMENQRRRFEKEKDDAFDYGGFAFAKEALNLIDNLVRSKLILESDETLKNTEALKKTLEHFDIIEKDLISTFNKNNIRTSLFINPTLKDIKISKKLNTKCIELHTGKLSTLIKKNKYYFFELNKIKKCSKLAYSLGLEVHAGHGLDYKTTKILTKIKYIKEFNIGHFLIGESILYGFRNIIRKFKKIINN